MAHIKHNQFRTDNVLIYENTILKQGVRLIRIKCEKLEVGDTLTSWHVLGLYRCAEIQKVIPGEPLNLYFAIFEISED